GSDLTVEPVSLPLNAWFPGLRHEFEKEDLAAARRAVSQSEEALEKARQTAAKADDASDEAQQADVTLADARHASAMAELDSLMARWAADFAKHASPTNDQADSLAMAAAKAERQASFCRTEVALLQADQALAKAKQAKDPTEAKAKAALTKTEKD